MKQSLSIQAKRIFQRTTFLLVSMLFAFYSFAQEKKIDVDINTKSDDGGGFFMQPWVWIVGGAVFLLLLVALLRNNSSKA